MQNGEEKQQENFTIDMDAGYVAGLRAWDGTGTSRIPIGDARFRIVDARQQTSKGDKPHVMLVITAAVIDHTVKEAIGMQQDLFYAGSRQSPRAMQNRLANLLKSTGVSPPITRAALIGREFDATVIWEKGKPVFDETTGSQKVYVNSRVFAERKIGEPRPSGVDPDRDSKEALAYVEGSAEEPTATAAPWAQAPSPSVAAPIGETIIPPTPSAPAWRPENEADAQVHTYRAYVALKTPHADQAREALKGAGFNPEGMINADLLPDPLKGQYLAAVGQAPAPALGGGLPPLGGASSAKKGTRSPKA